MAAEDEELSDIMLHTVWDAGRSCYVVEIVLGGKDEVLYQMIDKTAIYAYADAVLSAAHAADYEASIVRQLQDAGLDQEASVLTIADFREGYRPPLLDPLARATRHGQGAKRSSKKMGGLDLVPGVSAFTGEGFLTVMVNGRREGQWTVPDAREHALAALEIGSAARWDTAYRKFARECIKLDEARASALVFTLSKYRSHRPELGDPQE